MIDELKALSIHETEQWVLCRGNDAARPIVLFVHGGPGYPLMWFARTFDDPLLAEFLVVHWDQRNAGKSCSSDIPAESCTLVQIILDGLEVTRQLRERFRDNRILLVGHSWGTLVAAGMASESPADFRALVLVGTCPDTRQGDQLRYERLLDLAAAQNDSAAEDDLQRLGPPPYTTFDQYAALGEVIVRLHGFAGTSQRYSEQELADAMLQNREYSSDELERAFESIRTSIDRLGDFLASHRLADAVPRIEVPVFVVHGRHDFNTPLEPAKAYFDELEAPAGKHWLLLEDSAHFPMYDEPDRFLDVLRRVSQA
ncbi:Proline iminopeptidase [Maioricimonas rarisocia]|uniref:Proline iminopeptidase n=1 Tax=Maioricimonas rarisocia TaxID=2528026 RepID=A0A517Z036_9PLAN|nr:alpha/beta hydrolase [Maioricimonas rarisocia]QDU35769.1 Proline iminopeptidase [Maioricimonas rarisocia]